MQEHCTQRTPQPSEDEVLIVKELARKLLLHADVDRIHRMREGGSTRVYRIPVDPDCYYLRVLPEAGASFAPEAHAHALLRKRSARVPEVVYWEHRHPMLNRSVMVTTEIAGEPLSRVASRLSGEELRQVLADAGRDLALLNDIPVDGFGWVCREPSPVAQLKAEHPTFRDFALDFLDADLAYLGGSWPMLFSCMDLAEIRWLLAAQAAALDVSQGYLAHGDFDVTHIFVAGGQYAGIIDLGEIRGTHPLYDLAHFKLHEGERQPYGLLGPLVNGYHTVRALPEDFEVTLTLFVLLIGIRAVVRRLAKHGIDDFTRHLVDSLRRELSCVGP